MFIRVSCTCYAIMFTAVIMIQGRDGANKKGVCIKLSQSLVALIVTKRTIANGTIKQRRIIDSHSNIDISHYCR